MLNSSNVWNTYIWHILKSCHFVAEVGKKDRMVLRMKNAIGKSAKSSPKRKIIKSVIAISQKQ